MKTKATGFSGRSVPSAKMIEDDATEKLKKRARDLGLIVNASSGKAEPSPKKKDEKK